MKTLMHARSRLQLRFPIDDPLQPVGRLLAEAKARTVMDAHRRGLAPDPRSITARVCHEARTVVATVACAGDDPNLHGITIHEGIPA